MKTKLLLFAGATLLSSIGAIAQDQVWDFGNDETTFPVGASFQDTREYQPGPLTLVAGGSSYATIEPNSSTWQDPNPEYSSTNRLKSEGNSSVGDDGLPTRRYMEIPVDGPVAVKLFYRFSGTSTPRAVVCSTEDGTEVFRFDSVGDTDTRYIEADYNGPAGKLLLFQDGNAVNYYKLETSSTLLSNGEENLAVNANLSVYDGKIFVSNVSVDTQVNIYSLSGALVKSISVEQNSSFEFDGAAGVYIGKLSTTSGSKSVKLLVR